MKFFYILILVIFNLKSYASGCKSTFLVGEGYDIIKEINFLRSQTNTLTALGVGCNVEDKGSINISNALSINHSTGNWDILTPPRYYTVPEFDLENYLRFNQGLNPVLSMEALSTLYPSYDEIFENDGQTIKKTFYKLPNAIKYRILQSIGYMRLVSGEWNKFITKSVEQGKLKKCSEIIVEFKCLWKSDLEENNAELNERREDALIRAHQYNLHALMPKSSPEDFIFTPPLIPSGYNNFYKKNGLKTFPDFSCSKLKILKI